MSLESAILHFKHYPKRDFRFERYVGKTGAKMWQASCQFDVVLALDPKLKTLDRISIEYRQYIRGGVWVRRGSQEWTADDKPNGNPHFPIPPYPGQHKAAGLPTNPVSGVGLSLHWKEDGQIESGGVERYGYRDTAMVNTPNETDLWSPAGSLGTNYWLTDTPSIGGEWGYGDSVDVWIELSFQGFVVQVERAADDTVHPIRVLKAISWQCFWPDKRLSNYSAAAVIIAPPAASQISVDD